MFKFRGKAYSSAKEIAEAYDVSPKKFRWRIREKWSIEEALELQKRVNRRGKSLTVDGQLFTTHRDAAKHYNTEEGTLNKRLSDGWTIEEAFGLKSREAQKTGNPIPCTFLGKEFSSKTERNAYYGLENHSIDLIEKRLKRGYTERQAVGLDPPPPRFRSKSGAKRPQPWTDVEVIDGKHYPKAAIGSYRLYVVTNLKNEKQYVGVTINDITARWRAHCSEALRNVTDTKFARAIRKYGKSGFKIEVLRNDAKNFQELERQEVEEIEKRGTIKAGYNISKGGQLASAKPIFVDGKLFASQASAAEAFGIDSGVFNLRLAVGKSPEQAAGLLERANYENIAVQTKRGAWPTLKAACNALGLKYQTVYQRISRGKWTIEQALDLESPPKPHQMTKPVSIGSLSFESQSAFARYIGAHPSVVSQLAKTKTYKEIYTKYQKTSSESLG